MGIPIRNTQNNLKTSQYFRNHPDTAAAVSHPPIVRVRFSASGLPRSSFLVHAPGAATMSSPVSKRTICIKRIIICSLLLYHNSGSLFVLLDNMIELAERNCHYKSDKQ